MEFEARSKQNVVVIRGIICFAFTKVTFLIVIIRRSLDKALT